MIMACCCVDMVAVVACAKEKGNDGALWNWVLKEIAGQGVVAQVGCRSRRVSQSTRRRAAAAQSSAECRVQTLK